MQVVNTIIMKPIDEVKPYEKNPRKNSKTVELLVKVLPRVGFNVPLVIDKDGVIVKGHARYLAAKQLGMQNVPCVVSEADPESIKADRIADNKVFEFTQWVNEELLHEVDMLDIGIDMKDFGLPVSTPDFDYMPDDYADDGEESGADDEERRKRFEQLMAQQEAEAEEVQIVTKQEIENAKQRLKEEPHKNQAKYIEITCEKCGHVFFVREGDSKTWE